MKASTAVLVAWLALSSCGATPASASRLTPLSPASNLLPQTVQEVLSRSLSLQKAGPYKSMDPQVFQAPSKEGESPIYLIRLPATTPFYAPARPYKTSMGERVPLNFTLNGRPHRVYHWNLPHRRAAQHRRRLQQFHPLNHRSSGQTFRSFITKQELAIPKPATRLGPPALAPAPPQPPAAQADGNRQPEAEVQHYKPIIEATNSKRDKKKFIFSKKFAPAKSTVTELDFSEHGIRPQEEGELSADGEQQRKGVFSSKSQEISQEKFFRSTLKGPSAVHPRGEETFSQFDDKFEMPENIKPRKSLTKPIKSRAQKVSWAN